MDPESLYWETLIPQRPIQRKLFSGWSRALADARWWMSNGAEAYITNYGFKKLIDDPKSYGYDRLNVPDYTTAVITHVFIDIDYFLKEDDVIVEYKPDIYKDVSRIDDWCGANDIKRRWNFTGGGFHGFIKADGPTSKIDDAVRFIMSETNARIDEGCGNPAVSKRVIGSINKKYGNHVIPVSIDEIRSRTRDELLELAKTPRNELIPLGHDPWYFASVKVSPKKQVDTLGKYSRKIVSEGKNAILEKYGLDWNLDFCPAIQYLIMKEHPGNEDRRFVIKYLYDVLKIPFVDVLDQTQTVANLFYNLMENKVKAKHAIKERQCEMIYKHRRRFHPHDLRLEGLCPEECSECLEKRNL